MQKYDRKRLQMFLLAVGLPLYLPMALAMHLNTLKLRSSRLSTELSCWEAHEHCLIGEMLKLE